MHSKLIRILLSGLLVLPVCLTGVVTAFQYQKSREARADDASLLRPAVVAAAGEGISDESFTTTPIVPRVPEAATGASERAANSDEVIQNQNSKDAVPGTVSAPPVPGPDTTPDAGRQQLRLKQANREYFVRLTVDGLLPGRLQYVDGRSRGLIPAKRVTIRFVQHGKVISQAKPGVDGFFQAAGLVPGNYSVVASGLDGMLTFGIEVQASQKSATKFDARTKETIRMDIDAERFRLQQTESEDVRDADSFLRIDAVLVPPRDLAAVRQIMGAYSTPSRAFRPDGSMSPAAAVRDSQRALQLIKAETTIQNRPADVVQGSWGNGLRLPVFYVHPDGQIGGRLTRSVPSMTSNDVLSRASLPSTAVHFVRNGVEVKQAMTDQHGRFRIGGMAVGDYTFVAAGPNGVAAFGVSVMPHSAESVDRAPMTTKGTVRSVSSIRLVQQGGDGPGDSGMSGQDVSVNTSDPGDVNNDDLGGDNGPVAGGGGGGMAGGGGGGGGAGGGGAGGLGGLLLGGAIGGAIAGGIAAANNGSSSSSGSSGGGPIASPGSP